MLRNTATLLKRTATLNKPTMRLFTVDNKLNHMASEPEGEPTFLQQVELYFNNASQQVKGDYEPGLLDYIRAVDSVYEFIIPHVVIGKVCCIHIFFDLKKWF